MIFSQTNGCCLLGSKLRQSVFGNMTRSSRPVRDELVDHRDEQVDTLVE